MNLTQLYKTQISLTEWFEKSSHPLAEKIKIEDNKKRDRLQILNDIAGIPFDKPIQFKANDITNNSPDFSKFLEENKDRLCAIRLMPLDSSLPKLRMRGHTVSNAIKWFEEQRIDPQKYVVDFTPHSESQVWSTIFVVNNSGIHGEIISGGHHQLTQGYYDQGKPIAFSFDFKEWSLSSDNHEAEEELKKITGWLKISDSNKKESIEEKLNSVFFNDYLGGYFETVTTSDEGLWFVDYNRVLGEIYQDYKTPINKKNLQTAKRLEGLTGSPGTFRGKARVINGSPSPELKLTKEEVLVCPMTSPEHLFLMKDAGAIVTDLGGILSHAAIIAREFNIPCLVGTDAATETIHTGDVIEVNADEGYVQKI